MIIHKKNNCRKVLLLLFIFGYYPIVDIFGTKYDTDNDILIISTKIICEQTYKGYTITRLVGILDILQA